MMTTRIIPVAAINSFRLTCRNCSFGLLIPLTTHSVPFQCPNCASKIAAPNILGVVKELRWLKEVEPSAEFGFDAALEAREER